MPSRPRPFPITIAPAPENFVDAAQPTAGAEVVTAVSEKRARKNPWAIAPPPVKVVETVTSTPPPAKSNEEAVPETISTGAPPVIDPPIKDTYIAPSPVLEVNPDTSEGTVVQGDAYQDPVSADPEQITSGAQVKQTLVVASGSSWWKWALGLSAGALVLYFAWPKLRLKKKTLAGIFAGMKR